MATFASASQSSMARSRVLNPRRRRLLRTEVPALENRASLLILCALIGIVVWVALQKSHYDLADRDLDAALLRVPEAPPLYNPPLTRWDAANTAPASQPADLGPFPETVLDRQWQPAGRLRQFNAENLYEKINGEAERFLRQGFVALYYLVLQSSDAAGETAGEIMIELFDQGDVKGSMGIFSEHAGGDTEIEQQGQVVFFRTSIGLIGRKGRFFFRVAGDRASENIRRKSRQLTEVFDTLPDKAGDAPAGFRILSEGLGIDPELIAYQGQNVFQYDFAKDFWFGAFSRTEPERAFVHIAESPDAARRLFQQILEEHGYEYARVESDAQQTLLQHEYLKNYFAISHQGRFVFGLENVADKARIAPLQERFKREVARDGQEISP